jgi:uncharacterized repeat protein (TIGR01451 family)
MNTQSLTAARRVRTLCAGAALAALLVVAIVNSPTGASAAPGDADLALTKSDSPDPVTVGGTLTYSIAVQNFGLMAANDVVVTDVLSSDVEFAAATASSGTCQKQANTVTCSLGTVNAATSATVTITVKPKKAGTLSNTASVASPEDNTPANNQDTEATVVTKAPDQGKGKGKKGKASCATPTITGTVGDDVIVGTRGADVINAGSGNDSISGGDGKDLICAGSGLDTVSGGPKNDTAIGGADRDRLIGDDGNDLLKGKGGRDRLRGGVGDDILNGGRGRDSCKGGPGNDTERRCP